MSATTEPSLRFKYGSEEMAIESIQNHPKQSTLKKNKNIFWHVRSPKYILHAPFLSKLLKDMLYKNGKKWKC